MFTTPPIVHQPVEGSSGKSPRLPTIEVSEQIQEIGSLEEARQLHQRQGLELADAILASLPGGTVDALLVELTDAGLPVFRASWRLTHAGNQLRMGW